jgi:hypothetical protein
MIDIDIDIDIGVGPWPSRHFIDRWLFEKQEVAARLQASQFRWTIVAAVAGVVGVVIGAWPLFSR